MNDIENVIFDIAEALRGPVLVLALVALAVSLIELGAFIVELVRRRRLDYGRLETAAIEARDALARGDEVGAKAALRPVAWSTAMARALAFMVDQWGRPGTGDRLAKGLADFDFRSLRRLERTRLLVRAGPALGLMGTLIPLSPALEGLADGNTEELSDNLRVAFSVTVLGLLIGAIAFGISLVRDRLYGQDLSDLEFVAATLSPDSELGGGAGARPPRPAGAAALPPPPAGAAVTNKPPPPKDAKPLSSDLPPPGAPAPAGAAVPSPTPSASGDGAGTPPAPMPTGGQSTAASPPGGGAGESSAPSSSPAASDQPGPTAPPVPGASVPPPPPPPVPDAPQAPPIPPPPPAAGAPQAPPVPGAEPSAPPVPGAAPGDPPTQQLPPTGGDRPTEASNPQPGDGHGAPDPAPENR